MSEVQDYGSRLSDPNSRKMGTFSYLPELTEEELRSQVEYIVSKGWNPAIEHTEPENASSHYWYMWKLPMFGETDVDAVFQEITGRASPGRNRMRRNKTGASNELPIAAKGAPGFHSEPPCGASIPPEAL